MRPIDVWMLPSNARGFRPGPVQAALVASLPVLVTGVLAPLQIYIGNPEHFDYQHEIVVHLGMVCLALLTGLYLLFRALPRLRRPLGYPLALLGLFLLGVYAFTPLPVGELPQGEVPAIDEPLVWTLLEGGMLVAIWLLVRLVPEDKLVEVGSVFCAVLMLALPGLLAHEVLTREPSLARWEDSPPPPAPESNDLPNVYHVILDGFDGILFQRLIAGYDLEARLAGFVWYPNAYTNYTSTRLSFPSFMTGRLFEEPIDARAAVAIGQSEGLVATLAGHGYRVTQYNAYHVNNHRLAHERHSTRSIEQRLYGNLRYLVQLLDFSLLRVAPNALKAETFIDKRGLFSHWLVRTRFAAADWSRNPPLLSLMLLSQVREDEPRRAGRGHYVNGHFMLPHTPTVLHESCAYEPSRSTSLVGYIEQTACTTFEVLELVDTLRRLGRYRDAMLVIHSDHGMLRRLRPLLLVKYPGRGDEPLEIARYEVQLLDVAPTILDALGLDHAGLEGVPLHRDDSGARGKIEVRVVPPDAW